MISTPIPLNRSFPLIRLIVPPSITSFAPASSAINSLPFNVIFPSVIFIIPSA